MFNSLASLKKLNYEKVNHFALPAKPENRPEFIYTGRKKNILRPEILENYIKGGYIFSENRKKEINCNKEFKHSQRKSFYPNCNKLFNCLFPSLNLLKED
jgi:hypothetical protein